MDIEFQNVKKSFFGVPVLKGISFRLNSSRTLGLVGENGAGKSTLMNILGGQLLPDEGTMMLGGKLYRPRHPKAAAQSGIAFIHQELNLFANLSVEENLFLDGFPRRAFVPFVHRKRMHEESRECLAQVGLAVAPETLVGDLSPGERQLVEIARALRRRARLILFDEPTTSLTSRETQRLFQLMADLRSRGITMIYISHVLEDVQRLCDDLLILRDGEVVGYGRNEDFPMDRIISLMVGRSISQMFPRRETASHGEPVLEVKNISQHGTVKNISFALHKKEVLGIAGLMGSGRSELARIIFGIDPFREGTIRLHGIAMRSHGPRQSIRNGMAFLTEDRRQEGLCMEATIGDNMLLAAGPHFAAGPLRWIQRNRVQEELRKMREKVRLTAGPDKSQTVKTLSGGNQQKVVLAKWLLTQPQVFILDEPTRGIDVGARYDIYVLINQMAAQGAGILMISSELEELIGMCDRILVMSNGEIRDEIHCQNFDRERILKSSLKEGHAPGLQNRKEGGVRE